MKNVDDNREGERALSDCIFEKKLFRLRSGARPRVLDLFSGCGGISLGFLKAGFEITASVENDPKAAASHARNFHGGDLRHADPKDITQLRPSQLCRRLGLGRVAEAIDVIVGGPPCQAFARIGRSKLRDLDAHPEAFRHDPRAGLYVHYLNYVRAFKPLAILMENVPDAMNFGGHNISQEVCEILEEQGYVSAYTLLNAAMYGVPQMRERMFLVAYRREISDEVSFPKPTHWIDLPPGYGGSRNVALKLISASAEKLHSHNYITAPDATGPCSLAITAHEAMGDLPEIRAPELLESGELRRGARHLNELLPYDASRSVSDYARDMKEGWQGFKAGPGIYDHVIRYLPRDYDIFARMEHGDQYPQALAHARQLFKEKRSELPLPKDILDDRSLSHEERRRKFRELRKAIQELKRKTIPPYASDKFPNKWRKMWQHAPARTILAHLGKDSYSHIHYDEEQARTISVREAARLQSFPDGFVFEGAMNQAFRQIGNAVPPLMAHALAETMMNTIQRALSDTSSNKASVAATG